MTRNVIVALVAGAIGFSIVSPVLAEDWRHQQWCDPRDRNCDGRLDSRDRYNAPQRGYGGYGREPTYGSAGSCSFQTPRGPVAGYKPEGKDRCCVETRNGPSCQ